MIAGGIGINALSPPPPLAQIKQLQTTGGAFELHYSARSHALASYADELRAAHPARINLYLDDQNQKIPLERLLSGQHRARMSNVCGPRGMIDWVLSTAERLGWPGPRPSIPKNSLPRNRGKPFMVELAPIGQDHHRGRT